MLKRVHIQGYKSLANVDVCLPQLAVLFGPNAAGKSNFLDALQLLSKMGTSKTLKQAFDPPYRGKPLESFTFDERGIRGLLSQKELSFTIEVDLRLSDGIVDAVDREIQEMRRPSGKSEGKEAGRVTSRVRERDLRYRIAIEMLPSSGVLRVADENLAALNAKGDPTSKRKPFIERRNDKIHVRFEGQAHPTYYDRYLDHTVLSMPHYPPHYPHLVAARRELESWLFFYFEPRERMRAANPVKEVRHLGLMGEELAAFLNTMRALDPRRFTAVEKALQALMPQISGIEIEVSDLGEVELRLKEGNVAIPSRVLSEGTLRMLGLLALTGAEDAPALVGFEEPENGIHPRRIELIAAMLKTQESLRKTQYLVTTHSPILPDMVADNALFVVCRRNNETQIDPVSAWGPLARRSSIGMALADEASRLSVSERILRGDFDA